MENDNYYINGFITNLGKYNEGYLVGEWIHFPMTAEQLRDALKRIGIGSCDDFGCPYEEYFISDWDTSVPYDFGEYENLEEVNYLAGLLEGMQDYDMKTLWAACEYDSPRDVAGLINICESLDNAYILRSDVTSDEELGYAIVSEFCIEIPDHLEPYFNYEKYGRHYRLETCSEFTSEGFLEQVDDVHQDYRGADDIPEEYLLRWEDDEDEDE